MSVNLPEETRKELTAAIRHYFLEERDEEIGELQASFFLDFVLEEVGPSIYNQAIADAQAYLTRSVADLDVSLHQQGTSRRR